MQPGSFAVKLSFLFGGLLVWAGHFLFVYALNGIVCARAPTGKSLFSPAIVTPAVIAATAVAGVASMLILGLALAGKGPGLGNENDAAVRGFWRFGASLLAGFALVAIIWTALPALLIAPCA